MSPFQKYSFQNSESTELVTEQQQALSLLSVFADFGKAQMSTLEPYKLNLHCPWFLNR